MGIFINCLAVVFSTIIAICGISYFMREKNAGALRYYMLVMGFFGALWSGGYGIMGFTETAELAAVFRVYDDGSADDRLYGGASKVAVSRVCNCIWDFFRDRFVLFHSRPAYICAIERKNVLLFHKQPRKNGA